MGLVQSPGPFAGRSWAGAERLMAVLESAQLRLMNVDFAAGLWSLFFMVWDNTETKRKPSLPVSPSDAGLGGFLKCTLCQFGKTLFQEIPLVSVAFWLAPCFILPKPLRISKFNETLSEPVGPVTFAFGRLVWLEPRTVFKQFLKAQTQRMRYLVLSLKCSFWFWRVCGGPHCFVAPKL